MDPGRQTEEYTGPRQALTDHEMYALIKIVMFIMEACVI